MHTFDIIIIGSGAGGGTVARELAGTGAKILIVERGDFIPQEDHNWNPAAVWKDLRYRTTETWLDEHGRSFRPYTHYCVGGNTKFWGTVMYRLRPEDFGAVEHVDGTSPAWPIDYDTLAPFYDRAERMYEVHGQAGLDPTEGPRGPYPFPPVPHSRVVGEIVERLKAQGLHPSPLPLGLRENCIFCNTCNSFPCKIHAKSDADVCAVRPATPKPERVAVDQRDGAPPDHRRRRQEDRGGRDRARRDDRDGVGAAGDRVVRRRQLSGAAAALGHDKHPNGLANSSGLVGKRYMAHLATMMQGFHPFREERHGVSEDGGDQRLLLEGPEQQVPARPDSVAGPHPRRDGADRGAAGAGVGLRSCGSRAAWTGWR